MQKVDLSVANHVANRNLHKFSRPLITVGFCLGLLLSIGVLSGDEAGRVNLFYLLLVYLFIPFIGGIVSLASLLTNKGINFARIITQIPIWTRAQQDQLRYVRKMNMDKQWFFLQTQGLALAYGAASFLIFFILLLATDINFVWRSTLLNAEQILPVLKAIALPWWFLESAQPSIELLEQTKDSRLHTSYANTHLFGQWWAFIFATQIVYTLGFRIVLLLLAKRWIIQSINKAGALVEDTPEQPSPVIEQNKPMLATVVNQLPTNSILGNWANIPDDIEQQLALSKYAKVNVGPAQCSLQNELTNQPLILLVKAWEPPMGELQDFMEMHQGLLFPINYNKTTLINPAINHLQEWQRFTAKIPNWDIYQPSKQDIDNGE